MTYEPMFFKLYEEMTLHLTLVTTRYVLQVGDRVITERRSGRTYPLANKNVVYLARDGLVSVCYAGPAYLQRVPTDTWIACKLAGERIDTYVGGDDAGVLIRTRPKEPWLDIGQAVELLRREFEALNLNDTLDVVMAGWQRQRKGMRPVCWGIEARRRIATTASLLPRHWQYQRSGDGAHPLFLGAIPGQGWLSTQELYRLLGLLTVLFGSADAAVRRLIWAVRYVADKTSAVGSDCMCILLPNPDTRPELFVRYEPVTEERAVITGGKRDIVVPAAFTPWFVGPQIHAAPSVIVGGHMPFSLGPISLITAAPPIPEGVGIVGGFFTQRRPEDPAADPNWPVGSGI